MKRIFMVSMALTTFAAAIALFQMTSCAKSHAQTENCPPAVYPITGLWEGTYQTDQVNHPATYESFAIYPDGTLLRRTRVVSSTEYALFKGTWTLTGNNFAFRDTAISYSGGPVIITGSFIFSNTGTLSNGTWQDVSAPNNSGTFQNTNRIN